MIKDLVEITNFNFAAFLQYLGYQTLKCVSGGSGSRTVWMFQVPSCDLDIMRQEFENAETSVLVKTFVNALNFVQHTQRIARKEGGEYVSQEFKDLENPPRSAEWFATAREAAAKRQQEREQREGRERKSRR